ncbi:phospholipid/cholesterol/gamma-HCH transport system substrate-binding protein [Cohaesibacter sp. ES.047]|uniref:MlaD family protein n=1 Tax=Cohaesibacter sp. ES.047 TaxID=1798205 RepID=UPI000BB70C5D|nr:MlaD family protein [Cohaesibacter sp. ES.047]SNY94307.1 phospholipid/cholesterol/gamma-HCH transport system substrate-binding protein [Cohaesibacter sp. ES.047]
METKANYVAIGLFTLILTAVGFGFIYWIARFDDVKPMREVVVRFEGSVAGLIKGGQVMFNGIKVGDVKGLNYDPDNPQYVRAYLDVDSEIPLKKDSRIELSFQGLTGVGTVEIKGGSADLPDLLDQPGTPELTASTSALQDLMSGARQILARADSVLKKVEGVVDTNEGRISNSIENVEAFTNALKNNTGNIDTFLADASGAAKGLTSLSAKLETLSGRAEKLMEAVNPESVRNSVANIETFSDKLASASGQFDGVVKDVSEAAKGINDFSANLSTSLGKVDTLVESVDPATVRKAVASLQTFAASLDESSDDIGEIVNEAKQAAGNVNDFSKTLNARTDDFNQIITDAKEISGRLRVASERVDGLLNKVDGVLSNEDGGKGVVEEVTLAARSIRRLSESFESRADGIADGLARFSGKGLRDVESMVGDARRTMRRLESAVEKLENDPSSLIFGGNKVKTYNRRH